MTGPAPVGDAFIRRSAAGAQVLVMRTLTLLLACLIPIAAQAETIRLTPEQAEAAIEAGAARKARPDILPDLPQVDRGVHGEVGIAIGTGGYRSLYGVVGMPLGDTGSVVLGYNQERGRFYDRDHGALCRGLSAEMCNGQINGALLEAGR